MEIFLIKVLQFMLSISLLVLLHEGGHFFFSKLFGVRVEKFFLFFDLGIAKWSGKLFSYKPKNSDTEYGIGWLPLGGYCKISGMIDESFDVEQMKKPAQPWEFRTKPAWQRLLIMIGGVLVNFLLALFIYSMILFTWGQSYVPVQNMTDGFRFNEEAKTYGFQDGDIPLSYDGKDFMILDADFYRNLSEAREVTVLRNNKKVSIELPGDLNLLDMLQTSPRFAEPLIPMSIDSIMPGSAAQKAGLTAGDRILSINGHEVNNHNEVIDELDRVNDIYKAATTATEQQQALTVMLVYLHQNDTISRETTLNMTENRPTLGFINTGRKYEVVHLEYGFFESIPAGIAYGWNVLKGYVSDLKYVFTTDGAKQLGGFGTIGNLFPADWDWYVFWKMTAFLSIILAFMNILPIPALDGGHVLFLIYEMITGRKPSENFMIRAEYVGFGIVILLLVVANLNDILRMVFHITL